MGRSQRPTQQPPSSDLHSSSVPIGRISMRSNKVAPVMGAGDASSSTPCAAHQQLPSLQSFSTPPGRWARHSGGRVAGGRAVGSSSTAAAHLHPPAGGSTVGAGGGEGSKFTFQDFVAHAHEQQASDHWTRSAVVDQQQQQQQPYLREGCNVELLNGKGGGLDHDRSGSAQHAAGSVSFFARNKNSLKRDLDKMTYTMVEGKLRRWAKAAVWDVWDHHGATRMRWDTLMLITMVYVVIITPYIIAFSIDTADLSTAIAGIDLTVYCLFMLDILINFRTSYSDNEGVMIRDRTLIAARYVSTWFFLDVVSALPFDLIINSYNEAGQWTRLLRLLRLARLLKLFTVARGLRNSHVKNLLQVLESTMGKAQLNMLYFVLLALTLLHWAACLYYYAAAWRDFDEWTWVYAWSLVPTPADGLEHGANNAKRYIYSLYWAVQTMTTVGYGDIVAVSVQEKVVAICTMIMGTSMFAYFMGTMMQLVASMGGSAERHQQKRAAVDDFLEHRNVPKALADKVRSYYNYTVPRQIDDDEHDVIGGLSLTLRMQVVMHLYRETLERVPIFRGKDPQFIIALVTALKLEYYSPGDVIARQGEVGKEMYFIGQGTVEARVYSEDMQYTDADPLDSTAPTPRTAAFARDAAVNPAPNGAVCPPSASAPAVGPSDPGLGVAGRTKSVLQMLGLQRQERRQRRRVVLTVTDLAHLYYIEAGVLSVGDNFGTYGCLLSQPHAATVIATTYCELYSLSRTSLEELVEAWPEMEDAFRSLVSANHKVDADGWVCREQMGLPSHAGDRSRHPSRSATTPGDPSSHAPAKDPSAAAGIASAVVRASPATPVATFSHPSLGKTACGVKNDSAHANGQHEQPQQQQQREAADLQRGWAAG